MATVSTESSAVWDVGVVAQDLNGPLAVKAGRSTLGEPMAMEAGSRYIGGSLTGVVEFGGSHCDRHIVQDCLSAQWSTRRPAG